MRWLIFVTLAVVLAFSSYAALFTGAHFLERVAYVGLAVLALFNLAAVITPNHRVSSGPVKLLDQNSKDESLPEKLRQP